MSQVDLTKEEKLKRRQEQLARWKLKKADSPAEGASAEVVADLKAAETTPETGKGVPISEQEQKRLDRIKKLEEWKRKKQQQQELASPSPQAELDGKQKKLEAWKKKRQEANQALNVKKGLFSGLPKHAKKTNTVKRTLFADEDETSTSTLKFKKPNIGGTIYNRTTEAETEEVDPLDAFVSSLETTKEAQPSLGNDVHDDVDSELDVLADEEDVISKQLKSMKKEKELSVVDHSQVDYMPFEKNFYVVPDSIAALTEEEVAALRLEMDGIRVTGANVPSPIWHWSQLGLSSMVVSIIEEKLKFDAPTAIQSQALPAIMSGRDFLGIAKTGSGKTLAFVLPLLKHVQAQPPLASGDGPIAILMTPTRELALQIFKQLSYFTKKLGLSACCCYGGSSIEPQIAELKKGSQIVVCTPGRLIDLLAANNGRVCNLRRVTYVVLDEADRMLDFGFEPQVKKIFAHIRPDRQSILFSATFARKMESLAKTFLQKPIEVIVGAISAVAEEITQHVEFFKVEVGDTDASIAERKFNKLVEILQQFLFAKKLVFVEKQDSADSLLVKLLAKQIQCITVHGGKEQVDRKYAVKEFSSKDSGIDVLIATSVAARGLDVKGLDLVVNFDPPNHMEDYVHRVGRTGRAGNKGDAYTLVTSLQERPITDLVNALKLSKVPEDEIDPRLIEIRKKFLDKVKEGKQKFRFGFGGNGLTKLDEIRSAHKLIERKAYDADEPKAASKAAGILPEQEKDLDLPEFKVIEGGADETSGPDKCKFHSRITINDLPQKARWIVVNADSLAQIIEATSTSITNKGQYYPPGTKIPATVKQGGKEVPAPPKLYLLIEGLTENAVSEANKLIKQKMIEGLEQAKLNESAAPAGKYTV